MKQLTSKQAIAFCKSRIWENWTDEQIVKFQLFQKKLCMDFSVFHKAIEAVLKRPVYTHEFGSKIYNRLVKEFLGKKKAPTLDEIVELIPKEKRLIILH